MDDTIRKLRLSTGLSQAGFARQYQIPVSTLRKWEQGEATPPPYLVRLLAYAIPMSEMLTEGKQMRDTSLEEIPYKDGKSYFFDRARGVVMDRLGNSIRVKDDLKEVNRLNLGLYLHKLFDELYLIQDQFERDCHYDRIENIQWV